MPLLRKLVPVMALLSFLNQKYQNVLPKLLQLAHRRMMLIVLFATQLLSLDMKIVKFFFRPERARYVLMDMAEDIVALLDHLQVQKAHIMGGNPNNLIPLYPIESP